MSPTIVWFRNDLRLSDHAALDAAQQAGPLLAVFVLDDAAAGESAPGGASRWWLHHSLAALEADLARAGVPFLLERGPAEQALPRIAADAGAGAVFAGRAVEPWARAQETRVAAALARDGRQLSLHRTVSLLDPDDVRTAAGGPFSVYSPFARACMARLRENPPPDAPREPGHRGKTPTGAPGADRPPGSGLSLADLALLPTRPDWAGGLRATWTPGGSGARERLARFRDGALGGYADRRNYTGEAGTSMLSPHLHFGEISAAEIWRAAAFAGAEGSDEGGKGAETFLREILWREFSIHLLWHNPDLPDRPLRPEFGRMPWRDDPAARRAWQRGRTGIPMVDAAMRQLWETGWMHNRARMIAASFLVKHLLLPWQDGAAWFWDTLVDADLASNSASWQWVAGSGVDAAPYFRVFNPVLQGRKFDPEGAYVRRYVPELARLDPRHIHAPWEAPPLDLAAAGVSLGRDYPHPIVDLAAGRERALAAYRTLGPAAG